MLDKKRFCLFCLILGFVAIVKKAKKSTFLWLKKIKILVSLDSLFSQIKDLYCYK